MFGSIFLQKQSSRQLGTRISHMTRRGLIGIWRQTIDLGQRLAKDDLDFQPNAPVRNDYNSLALSTRPKSCDIETRNGGRASMPISIGYMRIRQTLFRLRMRQPKTEF